MGKAAYDAYVKKGTPWYKVIGNILFSHLGLFILVILYAVGGAEVFMTLEKEREDLQEATKLARTQDVDDSVRFLKNQFWSYATNEDKYNFTKQEFKDAVLQDLKALERFIIEAVNDAGYDGTMEYSRDFSFESALLFTVTIMTTVGYGHIAPQTDSGKLFCIVYALIGIPLMLVFMGTIGQWMAYTFKWFYSRVLCRWCRARRRDNELAVDMDRKATGIGRDEVGKEKYMPTEQVAVPITVNLILLFMFIFIGSIAFHLTEGWEPSTSAYFCFVTLTTIGFGDYAPLDSYIGFGSDPKKFMIMVFTMSYCILGMTLLSMCMSLMQEQIVEKMLWLVAELGGSNDGEEVVKVSKDGKVNQTPDDRTGNELNFNEKRQKRKYEMITEDEVQILDKDELNRDNEEDGLIEDVDEYTDENKGQDNEAFEGDQLNIV